MHMQVSKDLCRLSSELPFDLEECELAMEEDAAGGVDLNKLVKVRTCMGYTCRVYMQTRVYAVWRVHGACAWCVAWCVHAVWCGVSVVCARRVMFMCSRRVPRPPPSDLLAVLLSNHSPWPPHKPPASCLYTVLTLLARSPALLSFTGDHQRARGRAVH